MTSIVLNDLPGPANQNLARAQIASKIQMLVACAMIFVLVASNGRPFFTSSGFTCLPLSLILIYSQMVRSNDLTLTIHRRNRAMLWTWAIWVLGATCSVLGHPAFDGLVSLLFGYYVPFFIFVGFASIKLTNQHYLQLLGSFAVGVCLRFGYSAYVFYSLWGLPSLSKLLMIRYDVSANSSYMDVTFGNTGNTGSLLTICLSLLAPSVLLIRMNWQLRVLLLLATSICILNLLMTGSRTGIMIFSLVLLASAMLASGWKRLLYVLMIFGLSFIFLSNVNSRTIDRFTFAATVDQQEDNSIAERIDSMRVGFHLLVDNPMGIGLTQQDELNPYTAVHEFILDQGNNAGLLGLIATATMTCLAFFNAVRFRTHAPRSFPISRIFAIAFSSWLVYGLVANVATSSGALIPWIGLLAIFSALSDKPELFDKKMSSSIE